MEVVCFDLDDTLYKEIDYLKSAYKEIAVYAVTHGLVCSDSKSTLEVNAYKIMFDAYNHGENAFERLNGFLGVDISKSKYLQIYREHEPDIRLSEDVVSTLDRLKARECTLGIITDGRSVQQRSKINALELDRWISNRDIVISEEFGSEKPCFANYEYFMRQYPDCTKFIYVGDNPKKDFVAPNILGWTTICVKDDGRNVHSQEMEHLPLPYLPALNVSSLHSMIGFIDKL